jgi:TolB-like protein/DNA-binding winged helix-turn-helix (wHTH) protein/Tfp pilus assembly protein PilF
VPDQETIRFGLFVADLRAAELKKGQDRVPLQNLPFRILALLVRVPGRVVTREELRQQLWPENTFVDFERGISTAVSKLREALGDSATNPRFIETVGRRGYRFIAPVSVVAAAAQEQSTIGASPALGAAQAAVELRARETPHESELSEALPAPRHQRRRKWFIYGLAGVICIGSAAAIFKFWPRRSATAQPEIKSIAVLPLRNLSGDPQQEYLSDGLTEAVTTLLAQIADLRVISGTTVTHYKHAEKTTPEIAKELGVDALVEGSVVRSGNRLLLTVQLIQTSNDRHIWANSYDRELKDVVSLEGELSREIAGQIRIRLTPEEMERFAEKRTVDPEAYALYLQGRYYWHQRNEESLTKSIAYFEQAIARDPKLAPAYVGLADTYLVLPFFGASGDARESYERAGIAVEKALALDPRSADALKSAACVKMYRDWDLQGADREFQQALALNPSHATAHQWYAELLCKQGRFQEALVEINRALQLDPQSAIVHHQAAGVLNGLRQYPQALGEYRRSLELDPNLYANYFGMYLAYRRMGDYEHAIPMGAVFASHLGARFQEAYSEAARAYAARGKEAFLRKSLRLWALSPGYGASIGEALDYGELHEYDKCLEVLEREYKRHNLLVDIALDPEMDGLHSDPRFQEFLRKIGVR